MFDFIQTAQGVAVVLIATGTVVKIVKYTEGGLKAAVKWAVRNAFKFS